MGVDSKKAPPPLPAPTETDTTTPSELATDISKPGDDKSSYSIPEDGSPVTIRTRGHRASKSQTSLLIEYFEGGKNGSGHDRKPSVRVRLTPSKKSKGDHIQVTETKGTRKASLTRRIPLDQAIASREIELHEREDATSMTSYASATEESNVSRNPIDIEIDRSHRRRRPASPLIPSTESYQPGNPSDISAIPADSFLDGAGAAADARRSSSPFRGNSIVAAGGAAMSGISSNKSRSKDRVKTSEKSKDKSDRKRHSTTKSSKASNVSEQKDGDRPERLQPTRSQQESNISAADSSAVSSHVAPTSHRSLDTRSVRSGASKSSSINNPRLLETVEDAIRRLILPELSALKREQSKRENRRGSLSSSATSISREDVASDRRRSTGSQRTESARDAGERKGRRNREARHDYDDEFSLQSPGRDSVAMDYQNHNIDTTSSKHSNNLVKMAAAGAAGAALAKGIGSVGSVVKDGSELSEKKSRDRRRRRTEHTRSRSFGQDMFDGEDFDDDVAPAPPMPLMSDLDPSEFTRTSILSAPSERPHSASEELIGPARCTIRREEEAASATSTPTRAKSSLDHESHAMAMHHANVSHGDLTALPRGESQRVEEYETDEYGRKMPILSHDEYSHPADAPGQIAYEEDDFENRYFNTQDVPPPLRYVPYQAGLRGLSPIPSVSGYTEAGSEAPLPQNSGDVPPSPSKSPDRARLHLSLQSDDSILRNLRDHDQRSTHGADQPDETGGGQAVRGIGANPNFVHPPTGVESAVASLVDGSMLDQSVVTGASGYDHSAARDSTLSYNEQAKPRSNRDPSSPVRMNVDEKQQEVEEEGQATPGSRSITQSQDHSEYDLDEHGRKISRTKYHHSHSPTASEAAITAGAVGAAAAALKAAKEKSQSAAAGRSGEDFQPAGVARNRSFKERTMHQGWEPPNTPMHSTDGLDLEEAPRLGSSGVPDANDPMPEMGHVEDEVQTNPSMVEERLEGEAMPREDWSGKVTPTQRGSGYQGDEGREGKSVGRGLEISEAVGAATLGAAAAMAAAHSHERTGKDEDEWHRTSDERKRDTLVTNPYEGASPIANPQLNENFLGARGLDPGFNTGSPRFGQKYDDGYMSNGTPGVQQSKGKGVDFQPAVGEDEDPFYVPKSHGRHLSGMSQGMTSPFYDGATGAGMDRIENKDIIALMQHLMVRDAQRSARDTEIVALLMDAALEMRKSFREMKELVQDTGDDVIFSNAENTDKLHKAIHGPRPYPSATSRSIQSPSQTGTLDEVGTKKRNLWRRALQGLSAKGTNDLSRIEDMLIQLLGEVDVLRTQTAQAHPVSTSTGGTGQSYDDLEPESQYEHDKGHEAEGSSTPTHGAQPMPAAGLATRSRGPGSAAGGGEQKFSEHRISTVPENEEESQYDGASPRAERLGGDHIQRTPTQAEQVQRGGSVPLDTPPRPAPALDAQPLSAENTPRAAADKGKKTKPSSLGWLPKISRWSGTTASSVGKAFRGSGASKKPANKYDGFLPSTRSGSSLASFDEDGDYGPEAYSDEQLHREFLADASPTAARGENRTPQGPPPAQATTPEDPKYRAHRNSLNLQHPQPRPGQTERFRTALESSAQEFSNPLTPRSTEWAGSATSLNRLPPNNNRFIHTPSVPPDPESDLYSSPGQPSSAPPRPPKELLDPPGGQTPPKSNRVSKLQKDGSPRFENRNLNAALGIPGRRPSGPRAMTPRSPEDAAREERRRKRDTFGTVASEGTDTF